MLLRLITISLLAIPGLAVAGLAAAGGPKIAWSTALNVPVYNPPQAKDGRLYLTSMQPTGPNVFALSGDTGKLIWPFATQGAVAIPPTVGKTQVFVASDIGNTHFLRALDAKTGLLIWQYTRNQPPECMCSQAAIVSGNLLFAQSDGHSLYAFAPNGAAPSKRIWQFPGNGAPLSAPVVANNLVVFGSGDHNVYALDAKTGAIRWTGTSGYPFTADPVISDGVVIIGDQGGNIDGFDLSTGKQLWSFGAAAPVTTDAAVANGTAYIVSQDHNLYALDVKSGQNPWSYSMDDYAEFSPVLAGNLVIAANRAGALVAVTAATGKLAWQTDLAGVPFSPPIFWPGSNAIVLKLGDHQIAAYNATTGKPLWRYTTPAVLTPPVIAGPHVDVATSTGQVMALD
jgi:outer membrane protein assembly factor BamB